MAYIETTNQGNPNTLDEAWPVEITDGTNVLGTSAHPMEVAGTVTAANPSVSATGAAVPADATMVGATNPSGDLEPFSVDASGYLEVNVKAGSSGNSAASATGSAVPADADYIGYDNGSGNLTGVSSSTPLPVTDSAAETSLATLAGAVSSSKVQVAGTVTAEIEGHAGATLDGAAGSPSTQCVTVQGNSSGTAIPTTDSGLNVAQGSTTSGETGPLNQMATVTSAPTDTNAKTNPMRGDAAGNLRINPYGQTGSFAQTLKGIATGAAGVTLTVPTGYKFIFKCCLVKITIANSGSTRGMTISFQDASSNYLAGNGSGFNQTTNSTAYYTAGPSLPLSTSLTASSDATIPLPEVCLPPGGKIIFAITNGVAGDTIDVFGVNGIMIPD